MYQLVDPLMAILTYIRMDNVGNGSKERLLDAIAAVDSFRQRGRVDLAIELLDQIESFDIGKNPPFVDLILHQRTRIAAGDTTGPSEETLQQSLPPIWIRGWNFAGSMAKWTASGFQVATKEVTSQRLEVCHGCEHLVNDACSKCGCPCTGEGVLDKLTLATETCPVGKW